MEKIELDATNPPALQRILGDSAMTRILNFLILHRRLDYSIAEIAKYSGVGGKTPFRLWPVLEKYDLVRMMRKVGRAKLYRLNMESPIAKALAQLAVQIVKYDNEPFIRKELAKTPIEARV